MKDIRARIEKLLSCLPMGYTGELMDLFRITRANEQERCAKIADDHHLEQQGLAPGESCCGPDVAQRIRTSSGK